MNPFKIVSYFFVGAALLQTAPVVHASETECIKLAAYPDEGAIGVADDRFDAVNALLACKSAADAAPDNAQLNMLTARAYIAINKGREALQYLDKAASNGSWRAQFTFYDWATRNPPVLPQSDETKMQLLTAAAKSGPPRVGLILVQNYVQGRYTEKDIPKGVKLAKELADKGSGAAMRFYAQLIDGGAVAGVDKSEASNWLEKAALAGDRPSMFLHGRRVYDRERAEKGIIKHETSEGVSWINKAADAGYEPAQKHIVEEWLARNVSKDRIVRIEAQLKQYADAGSLYATDYLGRVLILDPSKQSQGFAYLKKAFELGNVESGITLWEEYQKQKRTAEAQEWENRLWNTNDLRTRLYVVGHYRSKGTTKEFTDVLAKLASDENIGSLKVALQILLAEDSNLEATWKTTEHYISRYIEKGGDDAKANVARLLMTHFDKRTEYYIKRNNAEAFSETGLLERKLVSHYHGPVSKAVYEQIADIFLTGQNIPYDLKAQFIGKRTDYRAAVDQAMSNYRTIQNKIDEYESLQQFWERGYASDCGEVPLISKKSKVREVLVTKKKFEDCLKQKSRKANEDFRALQGYYRYTETTYGFVKTYMVDETDKRIKQFHDNIRQARNTLERRLQNPSR